MRKGGNQDFSMYTFLYSLFYVFKNKIKVVLVRKVAQVNAVLTSSQDHIKIMIELQNSHYWEPLEI